MNSKVIKGSALLAVLMCSGEANAAVIEQKTHSHGIFGKMLAIVNEKEITQKEKQAKEDARRKHQEELEKEHERMVAEEEAEEAAERKKQEEEEERRALEAAQNTPQARALAAAKEAAASINVNELEANIAANLQSQLEAGKTK